MKPGSSRTLRIESMDEQGDGVAPLQDVDVHVAGALPGELVRGQLTHVSPHRTAGRRQGWARLQRVLQPAEGRVAPACPAYGACGGCPLQHWSYPEQIRWKGELIARELERRPLLRSAQVEACVPSPLPLGYRNQGKYVYGRLADGRLALGAYAPRSHELVDLAGCRLVEPGIERTARRLLERLAAGGVAPYDEARRSGLLRYAAIRSNARGEQLLTLVTASPRFEGLERLAGEMLGSEVVGVVQNVNPTEGNTIFGERELTLAGRSTLEEQLEGALLELSSRAFFQLNRGVAALAYRRIREAAERLGGGILAVDAYAGVGGIALGLGGLAREVIAIENNEAATGAGAAAARKAGLGHVRFVTADAAAGLASLAAADLIVLNPPRAGCSPEALEQALRLRPRLVAYLSCNPKTLLRDLELLAQGGLQPYRLTPLDMLPHTPHVETLALLAPA